MSARTNMAPVSEQAAAIQAHGQASGILDATGFFVQSDWEFALDTLPDRSLAALKAHLAAAPAGEPTAAILARLLESNSISFTPFVD